MLYKAKQETVDQSENEKLILEVIFQCLKLLSDSPQIFQLLLHSYWHLGTCNFTDDH